MKKVLLLSFIALIPCAKMVGANNGTAPQLAGTQSNLVNSPIAPFTGMNDAAGATCPTEEEFLAGMEAYMQYYDSLSPEDQQKEIAKANQAVEEMMSQLPPDQQEQLAQTMELLALEEVGQEILKTPEGQAFAQGVEVGVEAGAALKEQQIAEEVNEAVQVMAPMIEAEMAKNQPYTPALK